MPFIKKEIRADLLHFTSNPKEPGDYCFIEYKKLIDAWKQNRRWTTVDTMLGRFWPHLDQKERAKILAFLVFMLDEVYTYELEKKKENGAI